MTVTAGNSFFGLFDGESDFVLYANDTDLINDIEGVVTSSPVLSKQVTAEFSLVDRMSSLVGIDFAAYASLYSSFTAELGEIPENPLDNETVIGYSLYDPWRNGTHFVEVGESINVYYTVRNGTQLVPVNKSLTVVGVLEEIGAFSFGPSDAGMYISIDSAADYFKTDIVNQIAVKLASDNEELMALVSDAIEELFLNEVTVSSATALLSTVSSALATVELLLAGIGGISLLVAGIGIMNIQIVALMERTREIGILKSLGAKGRTVLAVFLGEALIIGLLGGIFGIGVGMLIANLFGRGLSGFGGGPPGTRASAIGGITPVITPTLALQALLFGVLVSMIFALYPAWRAAKLAPVDALRQE